MVRGCGCGCHEAVGGDVRFIGWCEVSEVRLYVGVLGAGRRRV